MLKAISRLIDCLYEEIPISSIPISFTRIIKADRNRAILQQYDEGCTLEEIAAEYSISLQRVHEIIKRWGP
ncbi:MAG: hypothetical protein J0M33_29760 [Anaerolineae bacterium]|nr:hypothetical protein [Anaerolineae bacterium]